jgi:hypothetical protein
MKRLNMVSKNKEFYADFKSVEEVGKKFQKKNLLMKTCLKYTLFHFSHVCQICFAYTLFCVHFLKTLSMNLKSAQNSEFFYTPLLNR